MVAFWRGGTFNDLNACYHVETATSDKEGKYRVPGWFDGKPHVFGGSHVVTYAHKKGYERTSVNGRSYKNKMDMSRFKGSKEERLNKLEAMVNHECFSDQYKKLLPYTKAIYEEGLSLKSTHADEKIIKSIKYYLDVLEIGWDEAQKRYHGG